MNQQRHDIERRKKEYKENLDKKEKEAEEKKKKEDEEKRLKKEQDMKVKIDTLHRDIEIRNEQRKKE